MTRGLLPALLLALATALPAPGTAAEPAPTKGTPEAAAAAPGAGREAPPADPFRVAYGAFEAGAYEAAAGGFLGYLEDHGRDDPRQEWARFFLGLCLHQLKFTHAAVDTLSSLVVQKPNSRIVSYSLEILDQISRTRPFDREQVLLDVLCEQEYGFADPSVTAFVNYYQGLYDWEHGYVQWGNDHFRRLPPDTHYYRRYQLEKARYLIDQDQLEPAAEILERLTGDPGAEADLRDRARVTLARVRYEQRRWPEAEAGYRGLERPEPEQARYLLERAWVQFRGGHPEQAMGLLYAFEAPSFRRHFTPEYYVLKSLIYKQVCHYREALDVVEEFNTRYRDTLALLQQRGTATDDDALLLVLLERPGIARLYGFMTLLEEESARAAAVADPGLAAHLGRLYRLQTEQTRRQLRAALEEQFERTASRLLGYQEQVHLVEYEVGLDMYQRAAAYHVAERPQEPETAAAPAAEFPFQGEFWNDELDDYRVVLDDRCETPQEWDIFIQ